MVSPVRFLPDYASCPVGDNNGNKPLQKVGINGVIQYRTDFNGERVLTKQSAAVSLRDMNGIHMSRLVKVLHEYDGEAIEPDDGLLEELCSSHDVKDAYWECKWESMHEVGDMQMINITCMLEGIMAADDIKWFLTLDVPYSSVCPCSAEMTRFAGHGIPHMQRAIAHVTGEMLANHDLDTLITVVANNILSAVELFPLQYMKRQDELAWCEKAADVNLFVEDAARRVADAVDGKFADWVVVCEHFESIHQHNVMAVCRKGDVLQ